MSTSVLSLKALTPPKTLREMAYKSLKEAILTGDMNPNEFYSEPSLAKMLQISRTPIREALQDLAGEGFVQAVPKRGYRVRSLQSEEVENLYDYRIAIELAIIKQVAEMIDEYQLIEIEKILRLDHLAAEKRNIKSFVKINRDFHRYLASLTNNLYFTDSIEKILELIEWAAMNVQHRDRRPPDAVIEHNEIFMALKGKNPDKAYAAMEAHLLTSKKLALTKIVAGKSG